MPPRPSVVTVPSSLVHESRRPPRRRRAAVPHRWRPGSTRKIVASPWRASVTMPACTPESASASTPRAASSSANTAAEISSPAASSRSALELPARPSMRPSSVSVAYGSGGAAHGRDYRDDRIAALARVAHAAVGDGTLLARRNRRAAELQHGDALRRVHAATYPLASSSSRICTALVAAPLAADRRRTTT